MRLGHVHIKVRDLVTSEAFYTRIGFRLTERIPNHITFLSFSDAHHDLALQCVGPNGQEPALNSVGLYHIAFEVPGADVLAKKIDLLRAISVEFSLVDHGISWALYTHDPDGNGLEFYVDRRSTKDGSALWGGTSRKLDEKSVRAVTSL